ncbi:DUF2083 domain-containing protein [Paracoccus mutanolyticus]|uniref:DUF2083 domain-containing protein n=1 Tax=Paracoccus mutanolyticus TaxID=1499308 RepID=UPI0021D53838|nr:DUF2083 domain-containing protein [Paracoccus mutanolyticus]
MALGCDLAHADRLIYARGLDLKNPDLAVRIGPGCKVCERTACPQRAFPMVGRPHEPALPAFDADGKMRVRSSASYGVRGGTGPGF